ncbi:MAG: hypothetical protein IJ422_00975 [Oscillospiraceae bacterium]|nr:hypothetical protein [Oscillospiraceae bacterium]
MSAEIAFGREQIDSYLKEVAKQYRKLNKKGMPAEITLIGGASILINYGFRDSTYDVDALIQASSSMKDAINYVTDTMDLPNGWLNDDFKHTASYTPRLVTFSQYYRTFSNMVTIRTITGEYLVAMKLKAFRQYKHDISDIVGILREHVRSGDLLTFERIDKAVCDLYDGWDQMPESAQSLIQSILTNEDMDALYDAYAQEESAAKDALLTFEDQYPDVLKEDNLSDILSHLMAKQQEEDTDPDQGMKMVF